MPIRVDAYTAGGIASGLLTRAGHVRQVLDTSPSLILERVSWRSFDAPAARPAGEVSIPIDDVLIAVADDEPMIPVHAAWHAIRLEVGPYLVEGELPTLPGFDPGRALTRPTGEFVLLRDVRVGLLDDPAAPGLAGSHALVNRYGVERVDADIMLGFFFPGAAMEMPEPAVAAAGAPA
jgi:hypothetical protein